MTLRSLLLGACALATVACSSSSSTDNPAPASSSATPAPTQQPSTTTPSAYPAGPYGNTVGKVLADEDFEGHVRFETDGLATATPKAAVKLSDVRAEAASRETPLKYAVVHTSAYWCGICKGSVAELVKAYPKYATKAAFVDVVVEGQTPDDVTTAANVESWSKSLKVPYTILRDPEGTKFAARKALGDRRTIYVVELETMKVLFKAVDDVDAALAKLDGLE